MQYPAPVFVRLSEAPDLSDACAQFHASLTQDDSEDGMDMRRAAFRKLALDGESEDAILALLDEGEKAGSILGLIALVESELEAYEDLGPWITGLKIRQELDGVDLAQQLVQQMITVAKEMGYAHLCAQTDQPETYIAAGFEEIEPFDKDGREFLLLGMTLEENSL